MDITFAEGKLKKLSENYAKTVKKLGDKRARLFHQRLGEIKDSPSLEDLKHLPGHYHSLTSNRNGQWACNLDHPYRLIFEPGEDPLPVNEHGTVLLSEIHIVDIIEIKDYH